MFKKEQRTNNRYVWKDLSYYKVYADFENVSCEEGTLGNLSETGMGLVLTTFPELQIGGFVNVTLINRACSTNQTSIQISGRVVWKNRINTNTGNQMLVGIEFYSPIDLPDDILAHHIAMEEVA